MLRWFGVSGFKAFDEEGVGFPVRPITVMLGANNTGKSSLVQALMMLSEAARRGTAMHELPMQGGGFDLGSFEHARHRSQAGSNQMTFWLEIDDRSGTNTNVWFVGLVYGMAGVNGALRELRFCPSGKTRDALGMADDEAGASQIRFIVEDPDEDEDDIQFAWSASDDALDAWLFGSEPRPPTGIRVTRNRETGSYTVHSELSRQNASRVLGLVHQLEAAESCLLKFRFLGPVRAPIPRVGSVGPDREQPDGGWLFGAIESLVVSEGEHRRVKSLEQSLSAVAGEWLVRLEPLGTCSGRHRELLLQSPDDSPWLNVQDVGTGIGQVLPFLVQLIQVARDGGTLVAQQPELHLHPAFQANLASALVAPGDSEAPGKPVCNVWLESHSEHLVRKLGVLIATKRLEPNDVSLLKLSRVDGRIAVERAEYSEDGGFERPFGSGFFPERRVLQEQSVDRRDERLQPE